MLWFPNPFDSLWTWQSIPGKPFGIVSNLRSYCIYILISRETDQYFRGLIEYLSSEYKRKEASGEKHNSDFASMMMANEISEEKAERKVSKLYYTNSSLLYKQAFTHLGAQILLGSSPLPSLPSPAPHPAWTIIKETKMSRTNGQCRGLSMTIRKVGRRAATFLVGRFWR